MSKFVDFTNIGQTSEDLAILFDATVNRYFRLHDGSIVLISGINWTKDTGGLPRYSWLTQPLDGTGSRAVFLDGHPSKYFSEDMTNAVIISPVFSLLVAAQTPLLLIRWYEENPEYPLPKALIPILLLSKLQEVRLKTCRLLSRDRRAP